MVCKLQKDCLKTLWKTQDYAVFTLAAVEMNYSSPISYPF